ncbi:MAG TPA: hypothetical protein VJN01_03555, partial [Xanthomonadales bacterium]|nr:hypothetical protein [Xanthomonadales bacterium]
MLPTFQLPVASKARSYVGFQLIPTSFHKMHGAGNDFVVIDHRAPFLPEPLEPLLARLCDRRRGVGADGVLLLESDP